jgi:hypothetical protein
VFQLWISTKQLTESTENFRTSCAVVLIILICMLVIKMWRDLLARPGVSLHKINIYIFFFLGYKYTVWGKQNKLFPFVSKLFYCKGTYKALSKVQCMTNTTPGCVGMGNLWQVSCVILVSSLSCTVRLICASMCLSHLACVQNGEICATCK